MKPQTIVNRQSPALESLPLQVLGRGLCRGPAPESFCRGSIVNRLLIALCLCALISLCLCTFSGCQASLNPITGKTEYRIDPNMAAAAESGAQATIGVLTILSAIWPVLLPFATAAGGILATWLKVKPELTKYKEESAVYHTAGLVIATGVEEFKKFYPTEWEKLCMQLESVKNRLISPEDQLKIENIIRGFRGLPPKS